ncbi:TetR/AcrR family transcriptional regulator [Paenibacillus sp. J22TS3]|uniref:TetR/AcrR family transcriptional regulator n=1 Tax=Paenibacillus sp. J22TS3 TaxID=2807192 RepID=UPI001B1C9537|nr:TetR/AcrR family transcriptional regulator [Paenibacillus sp. J22TS3]GIP24217.1 TetR family transcriptional regulator [Paenibacillus sp. J22TS3]
MKPTTKLSNRDVALRTAGELFLSKGYLLTSMDDIVSASGVSKTNIYYYFKSKEELLSAILSGMIQEYGDLIEKAAADTSLTVLERLQLMLEALMAQNGNCLAGCPFLTLYAQTPPDARDIRAQISGFFRGLRGQLEQLLTEGVSNGEFRKNLNIKATAAMMLSLIEGGLFLTHAGDDRSILDEAVSTLADLLK